MSNPEPSATMTVEQAGRLLGISRAAANGQIPIIRLGRRLLVLTASLHQLLGISTKEPTRDRYRGGGHVGRRPRSGRAVSTTYHLVSWIDHRLQDRARPPTTREYGTTTTKQAAIRLAEKILPPDARRLLVAGRW